MLQLESKEFDQNKTDFNHPKEEHGKKRLRVWRILIKLWSPRDRWPAGGLFNSGQFVIWNLLSDIITSSQILARD